jgi:chromate transporter
MWDSLADLAEVFGTLSLMAIGGANAVLPDMQRQVVEVHGWMTSTELARLFAVAQASPGPNMLVVALVGWQVAGVAGLLVATASMCGPSCLLAFIVARARERLAGARFVRAAQAGMVPVAVGLVVASGVIMADAAFTYPADIVIFAAAAVVATATSLNPLWILASAALVGLVASLI